MRFRLRPATPADLDAITAIYAHAVVNGVASYEIEPPSRDEMAARFEAITGRGYPYLVAEEEGAVLGYAYAGPFRTRPAYRWLVEDSIYLGRHAQRRGIGKALLVALLARCTELGFRQMLAVIGGGHPASVALHAACGFSDAGRIAGAGFKQGRWLDTVLMQKSLGEGIETLPDPGRYPGTLT
ncbi:MAG: GNAT family N-acetyltransferase [Rhizobiales bacterium 63-7]|nr:N-acetyltransferase [Hyphomicrobiales bacterium]OJU71434.1 MAG: GNAT family N-acetyltransferase [Rhizobiales bacterium 63-7]